MEERSHQTKNKKRQHWCHRSSNKPWTQLTVGKKREPGARPTRQRAKTHGPSTRARWADEPHRSNAAERTQTPIAQHGSYRRPSTPHKLDRTDSTAGKERWPAPALEQPPSAGWRAAPRQHPRQPEKRRSEQLGARMKSLGIQRLCMVDRWYIHCAERCWQIIVYAWLIRKTTLALTFVSAINEKVFFWNIYAELTNSRFILYFTQLDKDEGGT